MHSGNSPTQIKPASPTAVVREWAEMIKFEHSVFALPFALSGLILASPANSLPAAATIFFTILAFVGARSAAMTLNRVIDSRIDAANPRTKDRAIPAGRIKPGIAMIFAVVAFGVMLFAASKLPPICLQLSPIAVVWLSFYSFTKRFTWLCHLVLGIALGGAALGGWVAAGGTLGGAAPWLLALAVSTWVAGFDVIYACQDYKFDTAEKVFSIPARFGIGPGLLISRGLHVVTVAALIGLGLSLHLGLFYWLGFTAVAAMLTYEHSLVKADDLSKLNAAFFNVNGFVSIACFFAILIDHILKVH
ncbi:MAG: putative 4-hydroxybenzoate polyprenyltransferase [Cyanobacteria bacterium REEB67]|nr:putative 4-hydroxybenzoate polyprenyltransferase [Cyanobacteria bacterium REEB67]